MFFTFFKLYKWYQIAQSTTYLLEAQFTRHREEAYPGHWQAFMKKLFRENNLQLEPLTIFAKKLYLRLLRKIL